MKGDFPKTFDEHLDRKYGEVGTPSRDKYEREWEEWFIAEMVKEARKEAKMTQAELAEKMGVTRAFISKVERAVGDVQIGTLRRIVEEGLGGKLRISVEF